jgi:hypothetical protein
MMKALSWIVALAALYFAVMGLFVTHDKHDLGTAAALALIFYVGLGITPGRGD